MTRFYPRRQRYNQGKAAWVRAVNPMELLKLLYEFVGAKYPTTSLIIVSLVSGALGGGAWWLIGRAYEKGKTVSVTTTIEETTEDQNQLSGRELQRRDSILRGLHQEYINSHDGLSPGIMAGTEPPPKDWVERRLKEMGENWTPLE